MATLGAMQLTFFKAIDGAQTQGFVEYGKAAKALL